MHYSLTRQEIEVLEKLLIKEFPDLYDMYAPVPDLIAKFKMKRVEEDAYTMGTLLLEVQGFGPFTSVSLIGARNGIMKSIYQKIEKKLKGTGIECKMISGYRKMRLLSITSTDEYKVAAVLSSFKPVRSDAASWKIFVDGVPVLLKYNNYSISVLPY